MNRLAFDPKKQIIDQWRDIYLKKDQIAKFQMLINNLYVYLDTILTHKIKFIQKETKKNQLISGEKKIMLDGINLPKTNHPIFQISFEKQGTEDVTQKIHEVIQRKQAFTIEYAEIFHQNMEMQKKDTQNEEFILNLVAKYKNPKNQKAIQYSKIDFNKFFTVFQEYFSNLQAEILQFYSKYMDRNDNLIKKFANFKVQNLRSKIGIFRNLVKDILYKQAKKDISELDEESYINIKTLFENLFIEGHYLSKLINFNSQVFQHFEETDSNTVILQPIRQRHKQFMSVLKESVENVRKEVRDLYISLYDTTRIQRNDHNRLQRFICKEVTVNEKEFEQQSRTATFTSGIFFAVLLISLIGILVFRGMNLSTLEQNSSYIAEFKIWRGASYLIFMNWIIAIVFSIFDYCKVNYRLILIEQDTFVPKPQTFFQSAIILSSIYLILFLVYLLKVVNIIEGYPLIQNFGYFMWLINIVFLLNPFKILNYQGRVYFIKLVGKSLISSFRPMNNNIFFVTLIMCSFVQPFSDFAFTTCSLIYGLQKNCKNQTEIATFVYSFVLLVIGIVQNVRCHIQLKTNKTFTGPILSLISVLFSLNSVLSSLIYNIYLFKGLFIYWIISATIATIAGINADIRAHWALISFSNEDFMLRQFKAVPRKVYFLAMIIDAILNVGWVFTISNNLSFSDSINPMYFLMILSYIELSRKGMWMFFRVECDHSANVGNLNALESDQRIYTQLKKRFNIVGKKKSIEKYDSNEVVFRQSQGQLKNKQIQVYECRENERQQQISSIDLLKEEIKQNKQYLECANQLQEQFSGFLTLMHKMYIKLNWQAHI